MLRLAVEPVSPHGLRFQVKAYVNGVDLTAAAAGLGVDPFVLLVPVNRLLPTPEPSTVPFAVCAGCGVGGCCDTDLTITRSGDVVEWSWSGRGVPQASAARFPSVAYTTEVTRAAADRSWETVERSAARLTLTEVHRRALLPAGVATTSLIGVRHDRPDAFDVVLQIRNEHQIFLTFPWTGDPDTLARDVCDTLSRPTAQWPARWHGMPWELREQPPEIAGPAWTREELL